MLLAVYNPSTAGYRGHAHRDPALYTPPRIISSGESWYIRRTSRGRKALALVACATSPPLPACSYHLYPRAFNELHDLPGYIQLHRVRMTTSTRTALCPPALLLLTIAIY